jgi:hypothetical protein
MMTLKFIHVPSLLSRKDHLSVTKLGLLHDTHNAAAFCARQIDDFCRQYLPWASAADNTMGSIG